MEYLKVKKVIFVIIFFLLTISGFLCSLFGFFEEITLNGVFAITDKPDYTLNGALNGEFQEKFELWYNENFPSRNFMIKAWNQIQYTVFNESSTKVKIGKEGMLFEESYIKEYFGLNQLIEDEKIEQRVKQLKVIQDECVKENKAFLFLIEPNKVKFYPEFVPNKYSRFSTNTEESNYLTMIKYLEKYEINYFDSEKWLLENKSIFNEPIFTKTGTHWTYTATAHVASEILKIIEYYYGFNLLEYDIKTPNSHLEPVGTDSDIYNLLNIFEGIVEEKYFTPKVDTITTPNNVYPGVLIFGSSFGANIYNSFYENLVSNDVVFVQNSINAFRNGKHLYPINSETFNIEELLKNKEIIIIDATSSNITYMGGSKFDELVNFIATKGLPEVNHSAIHNYITPENSAESLNFSIGAYPGKSIWLKQNSLLTLNTNGVKLNELRIILTASNFEYLKNRIDGQLPRFKVFINGYDMGTFEILNDDKFSINLDVSQVELLNDLYYIEIRGNTFFIPKNENDSKDDRELFVLLNYLGGEDGF